MPVPWAHSGVAAYCFLLPWSLELEGRAGWIKSEDLKAHLFSFLIGMWISQIQCMSFISQSFKHYECSVKINRWKLWWNHIWNINYLISCQMKYCGSQDSFLSKRRKEFPKQDEKEHANYYIIIPVYLLLHLVFPFVMYACNYLFKSYLDSPQVPTPNPVLFLLISVQCVCNRTAWVLS